MPDSEIPNPEAIAAAMLERCAAFIDELAREAAGSAEQETLDAAAEAMRFERTELIADVTKPLGEADGDP